MSRSNIPGAPAGGQLPPRAQGQDQDAHPPAWPPPQPAPGWPQQGYAQPQAPAADPYGAANYHYPQAPAQQDGYYAPQAQQARPGYTPPQYDRFGAPAQAPARPASTPRGYPPEQTPGYHQAGFQGHGEGDPGAAAQRGFPRGPSQAGPAPRQPQADQWPTSAPPRPAPAGDPRGYDLGAYSAPGAGAQYQSDRRMAMAEPSMDPTGYATQHGAGHQSGQVVVAEQDYGLDDGDYETEEPRRRSRGLLIVGALIGAIGLGGGLAYAYKTYLGPTQREQTPVLKADKTPAKTQPTEPGGKQFANQGIKVMGTRLTDGNSIGEAGTASLGSSAVSEDGVRSVRTVPIRPDGQMVAPVPQAPPLPGSGSAAPPGMVVVGDPLRRGPQLQSGSAPPPAQQQVAVAPVTRDVGAPRNITLPPPRAESPPLAPQAKAPPPAQRAALASPIATPADPQAAAVPAIKKAAPPPPRAGAAPPSAAPATGSGYVAVLASQRSAMDALKLYADLQQKYTTLQGRTPSVQEANLGEKGVFHRLLVGPAGPREQATALCTELKAQGHKDCWVMSQ